MIYPEFLFFILPALLLALLIKKVDYTTTINPKLIISHSSHKEQLLPLVLALTILALARPVIKSETSHTVTSTPIFIAIDASNSMQARDIKPNRLEKAKELAHQLIDEAHTKVALLIFTQNPLLIAPPTNDKRLLHTALESFDPKAILTKGTNFEKLLDFVHQFEGTKNLIIISDGGEFETLKRYDDIKLYAVIVGTKSGALIPTQDGYLKTESGNLVVSRINPNFSAIAEQSFTNSIEGVLDTIDLATNQKTTTHYLELYFVPLLLAILLTLYIYTTIFDRFIKFIPLFLTALPLHAGIIDEYYLQKGYELYTKGRYKEALQYLDPSTLQGAYARAKSLQKLGKFPKALQLYKTIKTEDAKLKAKIYADIATCYEAMRKYDAARKAYIKAAKLHPKKEYIHKIAALAFKHNPKKQPLPFSKQKVVAKKGKDSSESKKGGSSMPLAATGGAQKGNKKQKGAGVAKSKVMPLSSKVYELINKGYIHEKNPW